MNSSFVLPDRSPNFTIKNYYTRPRLPPSRGRGWTVDFIVRLSRSFGASPSRKTHPYMRARSRM